MKITTTGTLGFLQWLKANQPRIYKRVAPELGVRKGAMLSGVGITAPIQPTSTAPAPRTWADQLKDLVMVASQAYLTKEQLKNQQRVMELQLQRAQQGLAPLDIDLSQYGVPQAQVNVGVTGDTQKLFLYGGLTVGALILLRMLIGSSRRG